MAEPVFLTPGEVVKIHRAQVERYGGPSAIRDLALLQSAVAMPGASFGKEWLHRDLYEMAAAYAFHISQDQPFIDGNKRTALTCALVFLELNGVSLLDPEGRLYPAMMELAVGVLDKLGFAEVLRSLPKEPQAN